MPIWLRLAINAPPPRAFPTAPAPDYRRGLTSTGSSAVCTTPDDTEPGTVDASAPRPRQVMPVHAYTTERAHRGLGRAPRVSAKQLDPTPLRLVELTEVVGDDVEPAVAPHDQRSVARSIRPTSCSVCRAKEIAPSRCARPPQTTSAATIAR
jgi:hypothetical protein